MLISFVAPSNLYWDTRSFTLYNNGTFPVCPQQRTGACKCHIIVVVLTLRVQKLTPAELRLFATQCGITIPLTWGHYLISTSTKVHIGIIFSYIYNETSAIYWCLLTNTCVGKLCTMPRLYTNMHDLHANQGYVISGHAQCIFYITSRDYTCKIWLLSGALNVLNTFVSEVHEHKNYPVI